MASDRGTEPVGELTTDLCWEATLSAIPSKEEPHPHRAKGILTYFSRFMELNERTKSQGWPGESPLR